MSFHAEQATEGTDEFTHRGTCDVCRKVDGDLSGKYVRWCAMCKAWICPNCWNDWYRRTLAALR